MQQFILKCRSYCCGLFYRCIILKTHASCTATSVFVLNKLPLMYNFYLARSTFLFSNLVCFCHFIRTYSIKSLLVVNRFFVSDNGRRTNIYTVFQVVDSTLYQRPCCFNPFWQSVQFSFCPCSGVKNNGRVFFIWYAS